MQLTVTQQVTKPVDIDVPITIRRKPGRQGALTVFVGEWAWNSPLTISNMGESFDRTEREFRAAAERYPQWLGDHDNYHRVIEMALAGQPIKNPNED